MWASKLANILGRPLSVLARWSTTIGMVAMGLIMVTVVVDVTMRSVFRMVLRGNIEIVGLLLVIVFFSAYAHAELRKDHIRVGVLVQRMSSVTQQIIITSGYLVTMGMAILLSWQSFEHAEFLRLGNIVTGLLKISVWPFLIATGVFMALFALVLLVNFLNELAELISKKGIKTYFLLLPGAMVALGLLVVSLWANLLPFELTKGLWGGIIFLFLFLLIFLNIHIAAAMGLVSLLGVSYLSGAGAALGNLSMSMIEVAENYTWSVAPLFLWMGLLAYYSGFAKELYDASYKWIGWAPGGLASASVGACTGLAAITGHSMTGVLTMGVIGLPHMRAYKYDMKLSTASICTASTIGCLIPPSIPFVVYGMLTEVSIGKLFIAGFFPGLLFAGILIGMITIMCAMNPKLGPPGPTTTWKEKGSSLKGVWGVILLIIFVLGGLYTGIFTPTEAGAMGCFGAILIGAIRRRLTLKGLVDSMSEAVRLNGAIMFIFVMATALGHFLAFTNLARDLASWIISLGLSKYAIISMILFIYMILGCIMNSLPAVILTLPLFFPMAMAAGCDPVWFGVLIVVMVDLGQITPPIGMNVFAMAAIAKDVSMYDIFRGVLPFWGAFIILIIILVAFPQISLFLPNSMF